MVGLAWNYGGLVGDLDTNSGLNSTQSGRVSNYALETMRHAGAQPIFSLRSLVPIGPKIEKFRGGEIPKSKYPRAQWNSVELSGTHEPPAGGGWLILEVCIAELETGRGSKGDYVHMHDPRRKRHP